MKITVDTDRLRSSSANIRAINAELEKNMGDLAFLVESLNGSWQGNAEKAYSSRLVYVRHEFTELERFFDEYAALLSRFADAYLRHEEKLAAEIMSI